MTFRGACDAVCAPGTMFEITETEVAGIPTKVFAGTPPNIRALFALAAARTDDFIIYEDERWPMPRRARDGGPDRARTGERPRCRAR